MSTVKIRAKNRSTFSLPSLILVYANCMLMAASQVTMFANM